MFAVLADDNCVNIGEAIRLERERANLSQEVLARKARLSRGYVNRLERNAKSPTIQIFAAIAKALGLKGSELLARAEKLGIPG